MDLPGSMKAAEISQQPKFSKHLLHQNGSTDIASFSRSNNDRRRNLGGDGPSPRKFGVRKRPGRGLILTPIWKCWKSGAGLGTLLNDRIVQSIRRSPSGNNRPCEASKYQHRSHENEPVRQLHPSDGSGDCIHYFLPFSPISTRWRICY